jgi:hypothetical protein
MALIAYKRYQPTFHFMAKKKKDEVAAAAPEAEAAVASPGADNPADRGAVEEGQAPAPAKAKATSVTVKYRDHAGVVTERVFSKEVHGDNFAALADEFKATNAQACQGLNG